MLFHWFNFGNLPITLVESMIEGIDERDEKITNYHALATAQLGILVGGIVGAKLTLNDFIPFVKKESNNKITKDTAIAFRQAVKENLLPDKVIQGCGKFMADIFALAGD